MRSGPKMRPCSEHFAISSPESLGGRISSIMPSAFSNQSGRKYLAVHAGNLPHPPCSTQVPDARRFQEKFTR